jgi:hypothetical protein
VKRAATLLVSLALLIGLPQMFLSFTALFSSGWAAPFVLVVLVLPVVPFYLMVIPRRGLHLAVPAAIAILSLAVSGGLIWVFYNTD